MTSRSRAYNLSAYTNAHAHKSATPPPHGVHNLSLHFYSNRIRVVAVALRCRQQYEYTLPACTKSNITCVCTQSTEMKRKKTRVRARAQERCHHKFALRPHAAYRHSCTCGLSCVWPARHRNECHATNERIGVAMRNLQLIPLCRLVMHAHVMENVCF